MIALNYAQNILNFLFATGGSAGVTPEEEMAELTASGVPKKVTGLEVFQMTSFSNDTPQQNVEKGALREKDTKYKKLVGATEWYSVTGPSPNIEYTEEEKAKYLEEELLYYGMHNENGVYYTEAYYGWKVTQNKTQSPKYPSTRYLALFTTMPDAYGDNYEEPAPSDDEEYQRINLDMGYFTQTTIMEEAVLDTVDGGATTKNKGVIYFPEVVDAQGWGKIVGFGIFKEETGGKPYLWGQLSNEGDSANATSGHVPLFRPGDFKLSLR